jgi:hypothetical protein
LLWNYEPPLPFSQKADEMDNESQFLNLWDFGGSCFKGTCYKAANWIYLGDTTGRGKDDQTHRPNRSVKAVWGYPLNKHFRRRLGCNETP